MIRVLRLGIGTQLVKVDLKHTYCQIPVHPQDRHLLGVMWNEEVFVDRALSFGLHSAPKIISAVSDLFAWSFHRVSTQHHVYWFDDFIFLAAFEYPWYCAGSSGAGTGDVGPFGYPCLQGGDGGTGHMYNISWGAHQY